MELLSSEKLSDVEFSFFGYVVVTADVGVTVADVAAEGVRNAFRGTDTQPALSPSLARASSNMNLPSLKNCSRPPQPGKLLLCVDIGCLPISKPLLAFPLPFPPNLLLFAAAAATLGPFSEL